MKKSLLTLALLALLPAWAFSMHDARLLRFPDINQNLVVFVYAGDIWSVPASGGTARKLTNHSGMELFPKISPDGKWIAFSAEYSGSRQVYVMPSTGGTLRQLTFYNDVGTLPPRGGYDHQVLDWTPDSASILVRVNRVPWDDRMGKYYLIDLQGGLERPLQIPEAGGGSFSPDGRKIVYTPISREFRTWKRSKGGRAQDVWIYDLDKNASRRLTDFPGTDQHPIWYKEKIYFVSDRDLVLNFYTYDLQSGKTEAVTQFKDYDVLWPSGQGNRVVFEKGGYLNVLDLDSGAVNKITVDLEYDNPNLLPYFKNVASFVTNAGFTLSPGGKRAAFDARGDIFTVPAESGHTDNLTRSQGVREFYPAWSPDGKWIACYSDQSGDYELMLLDPNGKEAPRALTEGHKVWKFPPVWSPDSQKILFYDKNQLLQIVDVKTRKITVVDKGEYGGINDCSWSADSRWLVYCKAGANKLNAVWVYSLDSGKARQLLFDVYNNASPVFSDCGRYIYFLSQRDFNMKFSDFEFDFVFDRSTRIYAVALTREAADLFTEKNDVDPAPAAETPAAPKKKGEETKPAAAPAVKALTIDFDDASNRVFAFPLPPGDYQGLVSLKEKIGFFASGEFHLYDIAGRKDDVVLRGMTGASLTPDGKKMLYQAGEMYGIIDIRPGQKVGDGKLNLQDVTMRIDPPQEWRQIFNEGWRIFRDWFYVRNMHGVDWQKMREKYAALLPYIGHRADLDFLLGELLGELNVGHAYVNWGDFPRVDRIDTGLLGADLQADAKAGRYVIRKIFRGENWNEVTRSPLTELGVGVREGDYLIALNGNDVTLADNPYRFLENTVGKRIPITVNSSPQREGARTYWIKPIKSELKLLLLDWVESRRRMVDTLSGGRIGYIYVPDTSQDGNRELFKGIYSQSDKEAWIIDDRYNGGGWSPMKMIQMLSQESSSFWHRRGLKLQSEPLFALNGPKAMLINHYSSSGGDNFPYLFKTRKLGRLIGTRTWGGLVGYSWSPTLVDGPSFAVPMSGIVGTDGEWAVEGVGIYPDQEVYDLPEEIAKGNDPSIEAAVKYLLEQLKQNPPLKTPANPAEPDRSKWFEKEIK